MSIHCCIITIIRMYDLIHSVDGRLGSFYFYAIMSGALIILLITSSTCLWCRSVPFCRGPV